MPTVELDNDVFAELQVRARPFVDTPSDVIRALIEEAGHAQPRSAAQGAKDPTVIRSTRPGVPNKLMLGKLKGLIDKALVAEGDTLVHVRKRSGEVFRVTVSKEGCVVLPDGRWFREPSPALREYTGSQIDGWANWTHERSGRTLRDLRDND